MNIRISQESIIVTTFDWLACNGNDMYVHIENTNQVQLEY